MNLARNAMADIGRRKIVLVNGQVSILVNMLKAYAQKPLGIHWNTSPSAAGLSVPEYILIGTLAAITMIAAVFSIR
jgi:hypothetical protein